MTSSNQFHCFFLTLINQDVLTSLLNHFEPLDRDQAKARIFYLMEVSLLDAIAAMLSPNQLQMFIQQYSQQPQSSKLLEYLDTCPQTSRLALSEVLNRVLFGLQTSLSL